MCRNSNAGGNVNFHVATIENSVGFFPKNREMRITAQGNMVMEHGCLGDEKAVVTISEGRNYIPPKNLKNGIRKSTKIEIMKKRQVHPMFITVLLTIAKV